MDRMDKRIRCECDLAVRCESKEQLMWTGKRTFDQRPFMVADASLQMDNKPSATHQVEFMSF